MRTSRRLVLACLLLGGLLGVNVIQSPGSDAAAPSKLTVTDPLNDTSGGSNAQGDIEQFDLRYTDSKIILGTTMQGVVDPTSTNWTVNGSNASWLIDSDGNGSSDYGVRFFNSGSGPAVRVTRLSDSTQVCTGVPLFEAGARFVGANFDATCIGRPSQYRAAAGVDFRPTANPATLDVAPNSGLSDFVGRNALTPLPAMYRDGTIFRRNSYTDGPATSPAEMFGQAGDQPVSLDGVADGSLKFAIARDTPRGKEWWFRTTTTSTSAPPAVAVTSLQWGSNGDVALAGDWNGDGVRTMGLFRPSNGTWYLTNNPTFTGGAPDVVIAYGGPGDIPVVGDWNNDGVDTLGVFRGGSWYLVNAVNRSYADGVFPFGQPGDQPVPADWNRDGTTTFGLFRPSNATWYQTNFFDHGNVAENTFRFGGGTDIPFVEAVSIG